MTIKLSELEALEKAATGGPWEVAGPYPDVRVGVPVPEFDDPSVGVRGFSPLLTLYETAEKYGDCEKVPDAQLIAAARNALPELLSWIRDARKLLKDYAYPMSIEYIGEYLQTNDAECRALLSRIEDS